MNLPLRSIWPEIRRLVLGGALPGALHHLALFVACLVVHPRPEYMGVEDAETTGFIADMFRDAIVQQQLAFGGVHLAIGAAMGLVAALVVRLAFAAAGRKPRFIVHFGLSAGLVALGHGYVLLQSMANYPQLYAHHYAAGLSPARLLLWLATDVLSPGSITAIGYVALAAGLGLLGFVLRHRLRALVARQAELRTRLVTVGLLGILCGGVATWALLPRPTIAGGMPNRPNVLVIAVDSLRADLLDTPATPRISALAARGLRFTRAYSVMPRTFPAWVSLLTGQYPHTHGIRNMFPAPDEVNRPRTTLPVLLRERGYRTGVISDFAGDIFSRIDLGFEDVSVPPFTLASNVELAGLKLQVHLLPYLIGLYEGREPAVLSAYERLADPRWIGQRALDWLREGDGRPFFLTLFYSCGHFPYAAPAPFYDRFVSPGYNGPSRFQKNAFGATPEGPARAAEEEHIRGLHRGAIAASDQAIGDLLDTLRDSGVLDRTLVVLTADHGENLYEHDLGIGHGEHLYGLLSLHVPLIFAGPGVPAPQAVDRPVRSVDVAPTLLGLLGLADAPGTRDGVDLRSQLAAPADGQPLPVFAETGLWFVPPETGRLDGKRIVFSEGYSAFRFDPGTYQIYLDPKYRDTALAAKHRMLLWGDRKLVYIPTREGVRFELYAPDRDPGDLRDLAATEPERLAEMKAKLFDWLLADPAMTRAGDFVVPKGDLGLDPPAGADPPADGAPAAAADPPPAAAPVPVARPAAPTGHPPLRSVVTRLVDALPAATVTPPLEGSVPAGCATLNESRPNPYTPLDKPAAAHHLRVSLRGAGPGRVDLHDALVFRAPRQFRFSFTAPPEARLEFDYALLPCGTKPGPLYLVATLTAGSGTPRALPPIPLAPALPGAPWQSATVPLDVPAGEPLTLDVAFSGPGAERGTLVAWSEPRISGRPVPPRPENDRNVLLIVVDAVRGDVTGPGRSLPASVTPVADAWLQRGTAFANAFAASNQTRPSTLAILQSQPPTAGQFHSAFWEMNPAIKRDYYKSDPPLLTRILGRQGYRVVTFGHNHFLWDAYPIGFDHGFDVVIDDRRAVGDTPALAELTVKFIEAHKDERWFLLVNFVAPHLPYRPPQQDLDAVMAAYPDGDPAGIRRDYLGEVAYVDRHLQALHDALERLQLADRTFVIVTADHGEVMEAHHRCQSDRFRMYCRYSHGLTLYDEEMHIPLGFVMPGEVRAGATVTADVSQLHLAPTILDVLGLPAEPRFAGDSLRAVLQGGAEWPAEAIYAEGKAAAALRHGGLKFIVHHPDDDTLTPSWTGNNRARPPVELYDLQTDPTEATNLALDDDPRLPALKDALARRRAELALRASGAGRPAAAAPGAAAAAPATLPDLFAAPAVDDAAAPPLDPELLQALRDLGYTR